MIECVASLGWCWQSNRGSTSCVGARSSSCSACCTVVGICSGVGVRAPLRIESVIRCEIPRIYVYSAVSLCCGIPTNPGISSAEEGGCVKSARCSGGVIRHRSASTIGIKYNCCVVSKCSSASCSSARCCHYNIYQTDCACWGCDCNRCITYNTHVCTSSATKSDSRCTCEVGTSNSHCCATS